MPEIADIFRDWRDRYPYPLTGTQHRAVNDICKCRTSEMKHGSVFACPNCGDGHFIWQSCGNRNCPRCGHDKIIKWLADRQSDILPVNYFMITFALPAELRPLCRLEPKKIYNVFFKTAADAMAELAKDKRFLRAKIGAIGTLQTWRRDGKFHPHLHFLVPGGGMAADGNYWIYPKNRDYLVPAKVLAVLFRGKFQAALAKLNLTVSVDNSVWSKKWVVDVINAGNAMSCFKYIAPYTQRGFISNNRIDDYDGDYVTFHYRDAKTNKVQHRKLHAVEFMKLYLQHVLPSGFMKTRYYGLLASANKKNVRELKLALIISRHQPVGEQEEETFKPKAKLCAKCGHEMKLLYPNIRPPPEN